MKRWLAACLAALTAALAGCSNLPDASLYEELTGNTPAMSTPATAGTTETTASSSGTQTNTTTSTEQTAATTTSRTLSSQEREEYEKFDPEKLRPTENEKPPEDTLPSVAPPPKPAPTTTTSGTTASTAATTQATTMGSATSSSASVQPATTTAAATTAAATTAPPTAAPPQNGWHVTGGDTFYYSNGKPVTGWQIMGGVGYYFHEKTGALSSKVGIDVSTYQREIDWNKVKAAGVDFAIIRVGFRGWGTNAKPLKDEYFQTNIVNATRAGIDCGVYFFSQAVNETEAVAEADFVLEAIKEYTLTYPVYFDTEYVNVPEARTNLAKLNNKQRTDIALAFCNRIKQAGYYAAVYSNKSWLENNLEMSRLSGFDTWVAQYSVSKPGYRQSFQMWQYTSVGSVPGIVGNVDRNIGLVDYPALLRAEGWNHLP